MRKYSYPAVFTPEDKGQFSVNFPDLDGCYTCGDDITDAIIMAEDVLAMMHCWLSCKNHKKIYKAALGLFCRAVFILLKSR